MFASRFIENLHIGIHTQSQIGSVLCAGAFGVSPQIEEADSKGCSLFRRKARDR